MSARVPDLLIRLTLQMTRPLGTTTLVDAGIYTKPNGQTIVSAITQSIKIRTTFGESVMRSFARLSGGISMRLVASFYSRL